MKITFDKYPIDILICILWSITTTSITLLGIEGTIRIILGLPLILFIPGYMLVSTLFPLHEKHGGLDIIERIALSLGISIAIVPLIGLALNYTPWGITLEPILVSLQIFIITTGTIAFYRWTKTPPDERFIISLNITLPKTENKIDKALTIILIISIITAIAALTYIIATPKTGEKFTEFYVLGSTGKAADYPINLTHGKNTTITIGIVNHEYKTINYTIEIWLINQTTNENQTVYNHMWFLDKINIMLNHTPTDIEKQWKPQWQHNYSLTINKTGQFKLQLLLFTTPTQEYNTYMDYRDIAEEKINSAYRTLHLWINVR